MQICQKFSDLMHAPLYLNARPVAIIAMMSNNYSSLRAAQKFPNSIEGGAASISLRSGEKYSRYGNTVIIYYGWNR